MPDRQYDFTLGADPPRGFMLARGRMRGRAWRRSSVASVPGHASPNESRFGTTSPVLEFREVFDDWSGGDGYAYRSTAPPNGTHFSENFDARWPGQLVHCQALSTVSVNNGGFGPQIDVQSFFDTPLPGVAEPPPGTGAVALMQKDDAVGGDSDLFALSPVTVGIGAGAFDRVLLGINGLAGRPASFGSFHYVPTASGPGYHQVGRDFAATTELSWNGGGRHFANAGNRLARVFDLPAGGSAVTTLAAGGSAGNAADWSATLPIGNGVGKVTDLTSFREQIFAGRPEGLYAGDQSGSFFNVTADLGGQVHPDNWRDLTVHEGEVVGPHTSGVFAFDPTTTERARVRQISPSQRSDRSPVIGRYRATESFGGWLYAGLFTGSASYLQAAREVASGDWRWYTLNRLPHPTRVSRLHFDGVTVASGNTRLLPQRLWVGTDASFVTSGTAPTYVMPIPRLNHNPLAADPVFSANYVGSARVDFPAVDRGAPGVKKVGESLEVWADGFLSGSRYADVYYTADRGARTLLGRAQTSPVSTLLMGSTNGSFVGFRSIELSLESFNTTPGTTAVYRAVVLHGNLRPEYVETIDAVISVADDTPDRRGTPMRPGSVVIDDLRELADPARLGGQPHRLIDLAGATSYVVVNGMPEESEVYQEGSENPEIAVTVHLAVLSLTAAS